MLRVSYRRLPRHPEVAARPHAIAACHDQTNWVRRSIDRQCTELTGHAVGTTLQLIKSFVRQSVDFCRAKPDDSSQREIQRGVFAGAPGGSVASAATPVTLSTR